MPKQKQNNSDFKNSAREKFLEIRNNLWPKTKKELEKVLESSKKAIDTGEKYLRELSEKGIDKTKKIALGLKREKIYYELGRVVAATAKSKWQNAEKIDSLVEEVKQLTKEIEEK